MSALRRRALALTVVALSAGALAELTGEGRLPFDNLRWRAGSPEILVADRWLALHAVQNVPATTLVADEVAQEGPAFADHFAFDLERLVERRGSRWGLFIALDVRDGGSVHRIRRLATRIRGRRLARALEARTEPIDERADAWIPPRIDAKPSWPNPGGLTAEAASEDLGVLAWHLAHRLASPHANVPWRKSLSAIRARAGSGISRRDFAVQIMSVLAMFADGHVRLKRAESDLELTRHVLPVRLVAVEGGVACVTADGRRFCSSAYPLVLAIDGLPLPSVLHALAPLVPRVSPDFQRAEILDLAREVDLVHGLLGSTARDTSTLLLGNGKGRMATQVVHTGRAVREPRRNNIDVRILPSGDGYLGFRGSWPPGQSFRNEIDAAFHAVRRTPRLIIDVRGNQGGDRGPVLHLLRRILPPGEVIIDAAAYRMDQRERPPHSFDVLAGRSLHPPGTPRAQMLVNELRARWPLPSSDWSDWHVATLVSGEGEPRYDGPIVILVDEQSASATVLLTSTLAPLDRVTTAGLQGGGGGGWPVEIRLPHSGLVVSLPSMFSVEPDGAARRAIVPELRHVRTLEDLAEEMAAVLVPSWALAPESAPTALLQEKSGPRNAERLRRHERDEVGEPRAGSIRIALHESHRRQHRREAEDRGHRVRAQDEQQKEEIARAGHAPASRQEKGRGDQALDQQRPHRQHRRESADGGIAREHHGVEMTCMTHQGLTRDVVERTRSAVQQPECDELVAEPLIEQQ
ncbi:MAG: S41 family peptidase [Thermoanaerobaculia bacterium]